MTRTKMFSSALVVAISCGAAAEAAAQRGQRQVDPSAIQAPDGYRVEAVATGLSYPSAITFGPNREMYVGEAGGHTYGTKPDKAPQPRIVQVLPDGSTEVVYDNAVPLEAIRNAETSENMPEGLISPITGLTWHDGRLYVTHRTRVSTLDPNTGEFTTIINGIPSWGEFHNNKAIFGPDGKMYFVVSTQGNSGPVDGHMIEVMEAFNKPDAHEVPCEDVTLTGQNYQLDNKLTPEQGDTIAAGVYVPLGEETEQGQTIEGQFWCHGAMYRANPDGTNVERIAWGLRSNFGYAFSPDGRLIATQNSGNIMQPRPIYNDWEPVYAIEEGRWYGWPDYYSSRPVTDPRFTEPDDPEFKGEPFPHQFALTEETRKRLLSELDAPPAPVALLPVHSAAEGMVFGREEFGIPEDNILVAEFGAIIPYYKDPDEWPGFRVQQVDLQTGEVDDFLVNKAEKPAWETNSGGLRRPLQLEWGPDGSLYVVDLGVIHFDQQGMTAEPETGIIWKVSRTGDQQQRAQVQPAQQAQTRQGQQAQGPGQPLEELTPARGYLEAHRGVKEPLHRLGGPLTVRVTQDGGGVFVALPANRELDPRVFGMPDMPLAYGGEPVIMGVPPKMRGTKDGQYTALKEKSPFGNQVTSMGGAQLRLETVDATAADSAESRDSVQMEASWTDADGNTYTVRCCARLETVGTEHPTFGGVVTNHLLHGFTGIGTPLMPTEFAYAAFWGAGEVLKDGEVLDGPRPIHGMLTEYVRNEGYELVFDPGVNPKGWHFHLMVPPVKPGESEGELQQAPVETGFTLPNGQPLPFWHVMFEEIEVEASGS